MRTVLLSHCWLCLPRALARRIRAFFCRRVQRNNFKQDVAKLVEEEALDREQDVRDEASADRGDVSDSGQPLPARSA